MDIRFECSHCHQRIKIDESGAGLQINCPGCQTLLTIPVPVKAPQPGQPVQPVQPGARALPRLRAEAPVEAPAPEIAPPVPAGGKPAKGGKGGYRCNNPNCGAELSESQLLAQQVAGKLSKVCPKCRGSVTQLAAPAKRGLFGSLFK